MTAGRASSGQPPPVSPLSSGSDWAAWLRQAAQVDALVMRRDRSQGPAEMWDVLVHLARRQGFAVHRGGCTARDGYTTWPDRRIRLPGEHTREQAVTALVHQLAHVLLHGGIASLDPGGSVPCQGTRKVEADSVAYLVTTHLGIDAPAIAFPHVSSWAGTDLRAQPGRTIQMAGRRVVAAAALINRHLDTELGAGPTAQAPALVAGAETGQATVPAAARDDLLRINQEAAHFFRRHLPSSWVPGYLSARGFGAALQHRWQAGYAPARSDALTCHLHRADYPDPLIEAAGVAHRSNRGTLTDVFRDRAMLPIHTADGTIAAFIGRARTDAGPRVPKYLNSPHTALYDKSSMLFGLWESRGVLAAGARPVIVEGPFDAIAVSTAGRGSYAGLAPCGTALTSRHLTALDGAADLTSTGVLVAFDADQAGLRAAVRAYHLLAPFTSKMAAVSFPAGQDAAQILQAHGTDALATLLSRPRPLADLVIDAELARWDRWLQHAEGQIRALRAAAPLIAAMPPNDVARQIARLSERLGLHHSMVTGAVTDALPDVIAAGRVVPARGGETPRGRPVSGNRAAARTADQDLPRPAQHTTSRAAPDQSPRSRMPRSAEPRLRGGRVTG